MRIDIYLKLKDLKTTYFSHDELTHTQGRENSEDSIKGFIKRAIATGHIIRIKRGLYCLNDSLKTGLHHPFVLAQRIYHPSFISLESAFSFHGLIPEKVETITSMTTLRSNQFKTPLGNFSYASAPAENFMIGVERIVDGPHIFMMATIWRSIADYVYCHKKNWSGFEPLLNSLRMEKEDIPNLTQAQFNELNNYYQNNKVAKFLQSCLKEK